MAKEQLIVELIAETKDAVKNLQQYTKEAKTSAQKVGSLTKIVKSYFAEITAGIIVARKIIKVVGDLTQAYMDQEDAVASMEAALKATGEYTPTLSQNLQDLAADLQDVTKYGDESTLEMAGLLQSLADLNGEGLLQTIPLVQDFATGMKVDLNTAASLIGKTLGSTTNALSRYGIVLDMTGTQQEKLAELADVIDSKFGGMAEAMGKTYAGQVTILQNAFGDLKEQMGRTIADVIKPMLPLATDIVIALEGWIETKNNLREAYELLKSPMKAVNDLTRVEILQAEYLIGLEEQKRLEKAMAAQQAGDYSAAIMMGVNALQTEGESLEESYARIRKENMQRARLIENMEKAIALREQGIPVIDDETDSMIAFDESMVMTGQDALFLREQVESQAAAMAYLREETDALKESTFEYIEAYAGIAEAYAFTAEAATFAAEAEEALHQKRIEMATEYLALVSDMISQLTGLFSQYYDNKMIQLESNYAKEHNAIIENITDATKQEAALEELDERYDDKRRDLLKKQAKAEKAAAIFGIIVSTAMAIMKCFAQLGPIAGAIAAVIIGGFGIAQIAMTAARPIPAFTLGGVVQRRQVGGFGYGDQTPAMLEPKEVVIDKFTAQKNAAQIGAMRSGEGGAQTINLVIDGRVLAKWIYRASTNKIVTINQKAVVA